VLRPPNLSPAPVKPGRTSKKSLEARVGIEPTTL
jgi:hypothetical protein